MTKNQRTDVLRVNHRTKNERQMETNNTRLSLHLQLLELSPDVCSAGLIPPASGTKPSIIQILFLSHFHQQLQHVSRNPAVIRCSRATPYSVRWYRNLRTGVPNLARHDVLSDLALARWCVLVICPTSEPTDLI